MKQPTPQQRLIIYRLALAKIESEEEEFMCNAILFSYQDHFKGDTMHLGDDADTLALFPEFIACKPKKPYSDDVWYDRRALGNLIVMAKRIDVLKKCIKMTERILVKENGNE